MYTLLEKAQKWSARGHKGVNRKFSGLPYIVHPEAVAQIVSEITNNTDVIAAAWLHDYVEDVPGASVLEIKRSFNSQIAMLVWEVSKVSTKESGNREHRVALDRVHYSHGSKWAKAIKIADMIHNMPTMIRDNPKFAKTYIDEKTLLLEVIEGGSPLLASIAYGIIEDYNNK